MSESLEDTIESEAGKAASLTSDAGSISRRSIDELIKADRYLASKRARTAGSPWGGCTVHQLQQPEAG